MVTIKQSIDIQRPVSKVFTLAGDYRHDPQWRQGVESMKLEPDGPISTQTTTTETMAMFGQQFVTVAEVEAYEQDKRTAFRSVSGSLPCEGYRTFAEIETGTRFTYSLTLKPVGLLRLAAPILRLIFTRQVAGDLARLRRLLEN